MWSILRSVALGSPCDDARFVLAAARWPARSAEPPLLAPQTGRTPLHLASAGGNDEARPAQRAAAAQQRLVADARPPPSQLIRLLLAGGASTDSKDTVRAPRPAGWRAPSAPQAACAAPPDQVSSLWGQMGASPLLLAVASMDKASVGALLRAGADPDARDKVAAAAPARRPSSSGRPGARSARGAGGGRERGRRAAEPCGAAARRSGESRAAARRGAPSFRGGGRRGGGRRAAD